MIFQATSDSRATVLLPSDLIEGRTKKADLRRLRVGGKVSEDPIEYQVTPNFILKFRIYDPGKTLPSGTKTSTIPVIYEGIKPDMFTAGRDVIIDGEFSEGVFKAQKLLTQCPSKYEPPSPEKQNTAY